MWYYIPSDVVSGGIVLGSSDLATVSGIISGTLISGGSANVIGVAVETVIEAGGRMDLTRFGNSASAYASDTLVSSGGMMSLGAGASATGLRIDGGHVSADNLTAISDVTIGSNGSLMLYGSWGKIDDFEVQDGGYIGWGFGNSG